MDEKQSKAIVPINKNNAIVAINKNKGLVPLSIDVPSDRIAFIYDKLLPLTWVVNFRNGKSTSSNRLESFLDITEEDRKQIVAFRFLVHDNKYTLTRKIDKITYLDGFFYHIKEGRATVFGSLGINVPYWAERVGFCYNFLGDAMVIRVDHSGYLNQVTERINKIRKMLMVPPTLAITNQVKERYKNKILRILNEPITYKMNVAIYQENIIDKKVNVSLFGSLDRLTTAEPVSLPRIYENTSEVIINIVSKN